MYSCIEYLLFVFDRSDWGRQISRQVLPCKEMIADLREPLKANTARNLTNKILDRHHFSSNQEIGCDNGHVVLEVASASTHVQCAACVAVKIES